MVTNLMATLKGMVMSDDLKETEICTCECHQREGIMHCMPCCDFTYEQYLNENGNVDLIKWASIFKKRTGEIPSVTFKDGKYFWVHK